MPGLDDRASVIGPGARLGDRAQCHNDRVRCQG